MLLVASTFWCKVASCGFGDLGSVLTSFGCTGRLPRTSNSSDREPPPPHNEACTCIERLADRRTSTAPPSPTPKANHTTTTASSSITAASTTTIATTTTSSNTTATLRFVLLLGFDFQVLGLSGAAVECSGLYVASWYSQRCSIDFLYESEGPRSINLTTTLIYKPQNPHIPVKAPATSPSPDCPTL